MPIKMYRMHLSHTNVPELNKSIEKVVLHDCNNLCTPQMGIGKVTIMNKGIKY